ncbi:hypothetical protein IMCC3317_12220 [Kordia antarctica]|uniref:Uncharacterized protein n=1 Tax=Kordia antarctica TaxID=1218801 RepID=A0A7L4ZIX2_9FLAO|nr:hypothetical protein IMCC3317_12220 [Kordia antarctica]
MYRVKSQKYIILCSYNNPENTFLHPKHVTNLTSTHFFVRMQLLDRFFFTIIPNPVNNL